MAAPRQISEIRQLISDYGFEVSSCRPDDLIAEWVSNYDLAWVHAAIVESLYQGRYKLKSIDQILTLWKRRGHPLRHFTREFESIILGYPSPPSPFPTKDSRSTPSPLSQAPSPAENPQPPVPLPTASSSPEHPIPNPPTAAPAPSPPPQNPEPLASNPLTSKASTPVCPSPEAPIPEIPILEVLIPELFQIPFPLIPSSHAAEASLKPPHSVLETLLPKFRPLESSTLESSPSEAFSTETLLQKTLLQTPPSAPSVLDPAPSEPSAPELLSENLLSPASEIASSTPDNTPDSEGSHSASEKEQLETPAAPFNPFFTVLPLAPAETVSKTFLEELSEAFAKEIATAYAKVSAKPFSKPPKSTVLEANGVILPFVPRPPKSDLYSRLRAVAMRSQVTS